MARAFPEHHKLMIAATWVYYVKIWTSDPFPDDKTQAQWAVDSWDAVSDGIPLPNTSVIQYVSNAPQHVIATHSQRRVSRFPAETQMQDPF